MQVTEEEEAAELSKSMMGKKAKRLYGRMQHGIQQKEEEQARLREKRRKLDESGESATVGEKAPSLKGKSKRLR